MIGATRRWFRRHRNGIAVGVGVVGAGYLAGQYILSKISEARERMSSERIARENLRRRFEQNQSDCTFTVLALLPTATENILEALPVEELTNELQQKKAERLARLNAGEVTGSELSSGTPTDDDGRSLSSFRSEGYVHASQVTDSPARAESPKAKSRTQLWNEIKINSLTRSFTLLYTLSLLTLLTRIQLNLLGRRNYLSSVVSLASPPRNPSTISLEDHDENGGHSFGNDFETNRRYLTFSWWLLHRGWKDLMEKVKQAVTEQFGPLNPREDMTQEKLSELTLAVRKKVEGATDEERRSTKWLPYVLPPREEEDRVLQESGVLSSSEPTAESASSLRHLLDETSDLIDAPVFSHILTLLNNEAFSTLVDNKCATEAFKNPPTHPATQIPTQPAAQDFSSSATIVPAPGPSSPKAKLATILAVISRQAHAIGGGSSSGSQNEYLSAMEQNVRELEAFAAVVYSSNFELHPPAGGQDPNDIPVGENSTVALNSMPESSLSTPGRHPGGGAGGASVGGEASIIDLGQSSTSIDSSFETVWGKAVERNSPSP